MTRLEIFRGLSDEGVATLLCTLISSCRCCPARCHCDAGDTGMLDWLNEQVPDADTPEFRKEDWRYDR